MKTMFRVTAVVIIICFSMFAQYVNIPIELRDNLNNSRILNFGLDLSATTGIDPQLGEENVYPPPPLGTFEAAFDLSGYTGSQIRTYKDYRDAPSFPFSGSKEHRIVWQLGTGATSCTINYNLPDYAAIQVKTDSFGTLTPYLTGSGSFTFPAYVSNNVILNVRYYMLDSNQVFYDRFNNLDNWSNVSPLPANSWLISLGNNAEGSPNLELVFDAESPNEIHPKIKSIPLQGAIRYKVRFRHKVVLKHLNPTNVSLGITYNGGATIDTLWKRWTIGWTVGPEDVEIFLTPVTQPFQLVLISSNMFSPSLKFWYVDDFQVIDVGRFPPYKPYNLFTTISYPYNYVSLSWADSSWNEAGFTILRKDGLPHSPGEYEPIGQKGPNSHWFIDNNILHDSTYSYRVLGFNHYGVSDTSTPAIITIPPLPVELISFSAEAMGFDIKLNWSTASELNNSGFEVERMSGGTWNLIGFVKGSGTTTNTHRYLFSDNVVHLEGVTKVLYRLKQVDYNGSYEYSDEVEVVLTPGQYFVNQNFPNPFNPTTNIQYSIPERSFVSLIIYDAMGNEIARPVNEEKNPGVYNYQFDGTTLASGVYFYRLSSGVNIVIRKMLLIK